MRDFLDGSGEAIPRGSIPYTLSRLQKTNFVASWTTRGSSAVVIVPKFAAPNTAFGAPKFGVFSRLKTSARTSSDAPARMGTRRMSARSTFRYDGPRIGFRDADRNARLQRDERCDRPVVGDRPEHAVHLSATARTCGKIPDHGRHEPLWNVASRVVALARAVEAVRHRIVRERPGQDRRVEDR